MARQGTQLVADDGVREGVGADPVDRKGQVVQDVYATYEPGGLGRALAKPFVRHDRPAKNNVSRRERGAVVPGDVRPQPIGGLHRTVGPKEPGALVLRGEVRS